jgi:hypothetical protein
MRNNKKLSLCHTPVRNLSIFAKIENLKKKLLFFLLFITCQLVAGWVVGQSFNNFYSRKLQYQTLNKQSLMASVFNLWAANNNENVNRITWTLGFNVHLSVTDSAQQSWLHYSFSEKKISGNTGFRHFNVDTLLFPQQLDGVIILQNARRIDTITGNLSFSGGKIRLPSPSGSPATTAIIQMQIQRLQYSRVGYNRILRKVSLINQYYGYFTIMQELPQILLPVGDADPPPSTYFLNDLLLSRLEAYIHRHHFIENLHLDAHDPLDFKKALRKLQYRQTRIHTLSQQSLQGKPSASDREGFTRGYVALSLRAMTLAEDHQPYIAGSYKELSRLYPASREYDFIRLVSSFYDKNSTPGEITVPQEIYQYFIDAASLKIRQQSYVVALDFLSNAAWFEQHFRTVQRISKFDSCLIQAHDGLATSYLKVSEMAFRHHDSILANRYFLKASRSLLLSTNKTDSPKTSLCFKHYARKLVQIAGQQLQQEQYHQAVSTLDSATRACRNLPTIDSLRKLVCTSWLAKKLAVSHQLLQTDSVERAANLLLGLENAGRDYCSPTAGYSIILKNNPLVHSVYKKLIQKSAALYDQGKDRQAMNLLTKARQTQVSFSLKPSAAWDSLEAQTTLPLILEITGEARLELWKKHFRHADSLYHKAQNLSLQYGVSTHPEIEESLQQVARLLSKSRCQWRAEQIRFLLRKMQQALSAYQFSTARSYYLQATKNYQRGLPCIKNLNSIDSLLQRFQVVFAFTDATHRLTQRLFHEGFAAVLPAYVKLDTQYQVLHLQDFGLPYTRLHDFVRQQHAESITLQTVHYFIQHKRFSKALAYLKLSKNIAKAKREQKQIAMGFVQKKLAPDEDDFSNPALQIFIKTYRNKISAKRK